MYLCRLRNANNVMLELECDIADRGWETMQTLAFFFVMMSKQCAQCVAEEVSFRRQVVSVAEGFSMNIVVVAVLEWN